jgi:hypothetical protein
MYHPPPSQELSKELFTEDDTDKKPHKKKLVKPVAQKGKQKEEP